MARTAAAFCSGVPTVMRMWRGDPCDGCRGRGRGRYSPSSLRPGARRTCRCRWSRRGRSSRRPMTVTPGCAPSRGRASRGRRAGSRRARARATSSSAARRGDARRPGTFHGSFTRANRRSTAGWPTRSRGAARPGRRPWRTCAARWRWGTRATGARRAVPSRTRHTLRRSTVGRPSAQHAAHVGSSTSRLPVGLLGVHRKMTFVRSVTARIRPSTSSRASSVMRHQHRDAADDARARLVHREGRHARAAPLRRGRRRCGSRGR